MDLVAEFLAVLLVGLSIILAAIGGAAARRYREPRLAAVTAALATFAALGALALLHEVSPLYGAPFAVAPIPLGLSVIGVALLYAALVRAAGPSSPS